MAHHAVLGVLACLAFGCSFDPRPAAPGDADDPGDPNDPAVDAAPDGPPVDAAIDAMVIDAPPPSSTTEHPSIADTHMGVVLPNDNFDGQDSMLTDAGSNDAVALVRFDLAGIPPNATIDAAELRVTVADDPGGVVVLFTVLESWDAGTATWNVRSAGVPWMASGVKPPSRSEVPVGSILAILPFTEHTIAIDPAIVAGWLAAPATNNGFVFVTGDTDGTRLFTREAGSAVQPVLRVTHTP